MKLWARLDEDDIVVEIIKEKDADDRHEVLAPGTQDTSLRVEQKEQLVRTMPPGDGPRGSYAAPGFKYDRELNGFVPPQSDPTDVFDSKTFSWLPAKPDDKNEYYWDDSKQSWIKLEQ